MTPPPPARIAHAAFPIRSSVRPGRLLVLAQLCSWAVAGAVDPATQGSGRPYVPSYSKYRYAVQVPVAGHRAWWCYRRISSSSLARLGHDRPAHPKHRSQASPLRLATRSEAEIGNERR